MTHMQVLIHVPGDREAVIKYLDKHKIEYKKIGISLWIKNCFIELGEYGGFNSRLHFNGYDARRHQGKPVGDFTDSSYGNIYLPFKAQLNLFKRLKNAIMKNRKEFYRSTEEKMQKNKKKKDNELKKIGSVIDFEKNVIKKEHVLEKQIYSTMSFISDLQRNLPKGTFSRTIDSLRKNKRMDHGLLTIHLEYLNHVIIPLKTDRIEALHILKDIKAPIQMKKEGKKIKVQKTHLRELSIRLNEFLKCVKYFLKEGIADLQITALMRKDLEESYEKILKVYTWYAELFKKESKK